MITAELTIKDSDGATLVHQEFNAASPFQWKAPVDRPIQEIEDREGGNTIVWNLWMFTYQPQVVRELKRKAP